jgi:hypothetical protein
MKSLTPVGCFATPHISSASGKCILENKGRLMMKSESSYSSFFASLVKAIIAIIIIVLIRRDIIRKWLILLLPFILLGVYCAKVPEKEAVSYTILESNDIIPLGYPGYKGLPLKILSKNKRYRSIYMGLHIDEVLKPQAPFVDFTKSNVLFISFGKHRTTGHSIKLINIYIKNNILIVEADFLSPNMVLLDRVITHYYLLLQVPKEGYKRVELRNSKGELRESAVLHNIVE